MPLCILPLVVHLFCKAKLVVKFNDCAVIKGASACEPTKYLVRNHAHDFQVKGLVAVNDRGESEVSGTAIERQLVVKLKKKYSVGLKILIFVQMFCRNYRF